MPGTVKSELLPDADRLHKCDGQEKVCEIQHLPLDKSHFITVFNISPYKNPLHIAFCIIEGFLSKLFSVRIFFSKKHSVSFEYISTRSELS